MNILIKYFTNKNKSNKIKFNIFKRNKKCSNAPSVNNINLNNYSFADNSLSNNSSLFTVSPQASDLSLLNKSQFVQDSTFESATIEEMYSDQTNVLATNVKLIGFTNNSFQVGINQSWSSDSIQNLDNKIRSKISELKSSARQLNIQLPAHITMLETIYNLRMNNLQQDLLLTQKKCEEKRHVNKLVKHFINASRMIRNHTTYWSKSIDIKNKEQNKNNDLEFQIKKQIDMIQNEIMTTICEIEIRFKKEQHQQLLIEQFKKQKTTYFTEVSMQKRIRLNKKRLHRSALVKSSSELTRTKLNNKNFNITLNNF